MSPEEIDNEVLAFGFEKFFSSAPCLLTVQDRNLRVIAANDNFTTRFGEAKGRFCYEVYKNSHTKCSPCPVEKTFADGKAHTGEQIVTLSDGREIPIMAFTSPVCGPDGEVAAVMEISADISAVKRLEDQLRESREQFRLLFNEAPCYISVQDKDLRIVQSNRKFKENFGDRERAYCYELYKGREERCFKCPVAATFHDGKSHQSEEVVTSLSGKQIHTLVFSAPIYNKKGEIDLVMEMSTDITQIHNLQGRLTNLGLFVGSISHGLKGLLSGLDGGIYLLDTGLEKEKPQRIEQGKQMIQRNVEAIRRVVLDLLYIAGEGEPQFEAVHPYDLAQDVADRLRKRAEDLQIDFQVDLGCEQETCEVDSKSLKETLNNLLGHAFEACRVDKNETKHFVRFRLDSDRDNMVFHIEDNGIGMEQEARDKMAGLFFFSQGTEGKGLGLFTAQKVIEKHRGTIEVRTDRGKGTTFLIRIPKVRA